MIAWTSAKAAFSPLPPMFTGCCHHRHYRLPLCFAFVEKFRYIIRNFSFNSANNTWIHFSKRALKFVQCAKRTGFPGMIFLMIRPWRSTDIRRISGFWRKGCSILPTIQRRAAQPWLSRRSAFCLSIPEKDTRKASSSPMSALVTVRIRISCNVARHIAKMPLSAKSHRSSTTGRLRRHKENFRLFLRENNREQLALGGLMMQSH